MVFPTMCQARPLCLKQSCGGSIAAASPGHTSQVSALASHAESENHRCALLIINTQRAVITLQEQGTARILAGMQLDIN